MAALKARLLQLYFKIIKLFRINKVLASVLFVAFTTLVYIAVKKIFGFVRPPVTKAQEVAVLVAERFTD